MPWPSLADYNAALSKAPGSLLPTSLQDFRVVNGPMGLPMPVSGGYAYIYELRGPGGERKALRCFREDEPARRSRAAASCAALAKLLEAAPTLRPYFIAASWEERCLELKSGDAPAMVMDWAEARTLGAELEAMECDGSAFGRTRERIAALVRALASAGVVHGDLQTGNILVRGDGTPLVIDYDGLLLPGGFAEPSPDAHPHFQHPEWDDGCDPHLKDRFPAIAIDLGLAALAERPELFPLFSNGENVLFRAEDYAEPHASPVFAAVSSIPRFSRAAQLFAGLALGSPSALPSLDEFRAEAYRAGAEGNAAWLAGGAGRHELPRNAPAYQGPYRVFSATDYGAIEGAVGEKVEVVGLALEVHEGTTKYGDPYVFVNFGDWRIDSFKLTIWSEGLESFRHSPGSDWEGRWVSAVGLVDEPYRSQRYGTTQLSITIKDASQVRFIDEAEARRRLGRPAPATNATPRNPAATGALGEARAAPPARQTNAELLRSLDTSSASTAARSSGAAPRTPARTTSSNQPQSRSSGSGLGGVLAWILVIGFFALSVAMCGR